MHAQFLRPPIAPVRRRAIVLASLFVSLLTGAALAATPAAGTAELEESVIGATDPSPRVIMETTLGTVTIELDPKAAPATVSNFLDLVDNGFYDGLIFHRVIANFVVQAGGYDPKLNFRDPPRTVVNESLNGLSNRKGTLAMARTNDPDSADAQFFINVKDNRRLDGRRGKPGYTVFGKVVDGWPVIETIELVNTGSAGGMAGVPEQPVVIRRMHRSQSDA